MQNRRHTVLATLAGVALAGLAVGCDPTHTGASAAATPSASASQSDGSSPSAAPSATLLSSAPIAVTHTTAPAGVHSSGPSATSSPKTTFAPCYIQPGFQKFAHLDSARTHLDSAGSGATTVTLTFETCRYNTAFEEEVRYTPTGPATTLALAPGAVVEVVNDSASPVPIPVHQLPGYKDVNSGYFYVHLDAQGQVAALTEIFHP